MDAERGAAVRDPVQRLGGVVHPLEKLLLRRSPFPLRAGVEHDVFAAHQRGGLTGADELLHRGLAHRGIQRGDVDVFGERRVQRRGGDFELAHLLAGAAHVVGVVEVEMPGR